MACPAAEFLKEACRFNADYKQRTNFKRFMNRVRKTFQVESSDSSSNPLSSSKWYTEHSAVKSSDPRNHQLMVMTGDSFEVAEQFAQSIIPSNTVRGTMSDGGIKNAFNYLREIGFFGENAPSIPHDEFPSAHDRRMMALGAAMFSHIRAFKNFQKHCLPGTAANQVQDQLEEAYGAEAKPIDLFGDFMDDMCDTLTKLSMAKGETIAQRYEKSNPNPASVMPINSGFDSDEINQGKQQSFENKLQQRKP